ncbi:MAG: hypothetical protein ABSH46_14535 [Bryobacteraceae bacterium]
MNPSTCYLKLTSAVRSTLSTRAGRRCWVVALYAFLLGGVTGLAVEFWFHGSPLWLFPGAVAMSLALVLWFLLACRAVPTIQSNMFEKSDNPLIDERQKGVRDRAYRQAYHVVSVLAFLSLLAGFRILVVMDHFRELMTPRHFLALSFLYATGVMVLMPSLPSACLAWIEPDDVEPSNSRPEAARVPAR